MVVLAISAVSVFVYTELQIMKDSYSSKIEVSFTKSPVVFDYSCGTNDYEIYFVVYNVGQKSVVDLSFSITNPLCVGSIPALQKTLNASSTMSFYSQTTSENGTLTISGNNTFVQIDF